LDLFFLSTSKTRYKRFFVVVNKNFSTEIFLGNKKNPYAGTHSSYEVGFNSFMRRGDTCSNNTDCLFLWSRRSSQAREPANIQKRGRKHPYKGVVFTSHSKGEGMTRSLFIAFCAVVPAFASLSSPLPPLGLAVSSGQVNLRPATALKATAGLLQQISGKDEKQIPSQLTSTMPPDSRPGVSFHDDGETSFRVWAPHARKVSLQVISMQM
jgi:hypothetical protein